MSRGGYANRSTSAGAWKAIGDLKAQVGVDALVSTGRVGGASINPALKPALLPPDRRAPIKRIADFTRTGHGYTVNGAGGTIADDAGVSLSGVAQSLKISTSSTVDAQNQAVTPFDMTVGYLRIKVRVDVIARLGSLNLLLGDGTNFSQLSGAGFIGFASNISDDGEWVTFVVAKDDFPANTVTWSAITRVMLRVTATGGAVNVWAHSIDLMANPANGVIVPYFDDGFRSNLDAWAYMSRYGYRGTIVPIRDQISAGTGGSLYLGIDHLKAMYDDGWDVGAHADQTVNHNLTNGLADLSLANFELECVRMKTWLLANGFSRSADIFAWPRGGKTPAHLDIARRYFSAIRTFRVNLNAFEADAFPFADPIRLRQCAVTNGASAESAATVNALVDKAMLGKKALILTFHGTKDGNGSTDYPLTNFKTIVDNWATKGYAVKPLSEVFRTGVVA